MARTSKRLEPFDRAVVEILLEAVETRGVSRRKLADDSGMGLNRVAIILRLEEPPATVGEVARLAAALGLSPSAVFAKAEALTSRPSPDHYTLAADLSDTPTDRDRFDAEHNHDEPA